LDGSFCNAVVVMGSSPSKTDRLMEVGKVLGECSGREHGAVVGLVLLWDDSEVATELFELVFCLEGLCRVDVDL